MQHSELVVQLLEPGVQPLEHGLQLLELGLQLLELGLKLRELELGNLSILVYICIIFNNVTDGAICAESRASK